MKDLNVVGAGRQIGNRKFAVLIGHGIIMIVHDDHVGLHPTMDRTLDIESASLFNFSLIYLTLNGLRDIEQTVVALEKLNIVQDGVIVPQRDLGIDRHALNVW